MRDYSKLPFTDLEIDEAIDRVIVGKNAERNKTILRLALLRGFTYEQIDEWLSLNNDIPERYKIKVKQIGRVVRSGEVRVFRQLHKENGQ